MSGLKSHHGYWHQQRRRKLRKRQLRARIRSAERGEEN